tara:strand:- start:226 stop:432 length:207 start_codon:yes stop_codon:yes gene_type:complete
MKIITLTILLLFLTNCSSHTVKLGKRCTKLADDNTYEKSLIWFIDRNNLNDFDNKINKKNCEINEDKS